jgi:hypothetical protein
MRRDRELKKLQESLKAPKKAVETDSVATDDAGFTVDDLAQHLALSQVLVATLDSIISAEEDATLDDVLSVLTDGLDDNEVDFVLDNVGLLLTYLKVPNTMLDSLTADDADIAEVEFETLKDIVVDAIGDGTIFDFVAHALTNEKLPNLDEVSLDDVQMDWSFYSNGGECQAARKESDGFKKKCIKGYKDGQKGFWLYPKDFENSKTMGVSASNHKSKGANIKYRPSHKRVWKSSSRKSFLKSMKKHGRVKSVSKKVGV